MTKLRKATALNPLTAVAGSGIILLASLNNVAAEPSELQNQYQGNVFNNLMLAEMNEQVANQLTQTSGNKQQENASQRDLPFAESRFMQHVGSVELLFGITQFASTTGDSNSFIVGESFSYANKKQPLLLGSRAGTRFDSIETRYDLSDDDALESDIYSLGLGMFVKQGLMVGFKYDRTTSRIYRDVVQTNTYKSDQYDFFTKYVHKLGNGKAVNLEASYAIDTAIDNERGDNQTINISGDYYVNQKNSIGFGIERITSEENVVDGDVISFELRSFITPKFSVAAGLEKYSSENLLFSDDRSIDINFDARF